MDLFLQTLLNGLLQSGIYALVASGLALAVGVVGIVNFAHGEFLMIGAFMAWAASAFLGIDPLLSLPIVAVAVFGVGALTYRVSIRHVLLAPELNQMLLTFGLGILLQNLALMLLGGNTRTVTTPYQASSLNIGELSIGGPKAIAFGLAVVLLGALYFMLYRTVLGRQMRAVAQNRRGAQLIGIPVDRVYLIAFGVSCGLAAVAGVLVSVLLFASPTVGLVFALKAFAIIVMAGLGRAFQVVRPFPEMTVHENVTVGALFGQPGTTLPQARERAYDLLERTGLADQAARAAHELTLLQDKRMEIARALATGPRVLLLDEVMAGLRPGEAAEAVELIRSVRADGVSVLFIEHIMPVVRDLADRVVVMDQGQVIAHGTYREVAAHPQVVAAYLGTEEGLGA